MLMVHVLLTTPQTICLNIKKLESSVFTLPISEVHDTTIVLGTVVDSRTRDVMLMGRLGLFGSTPFLVGGRYPYKEHNKFSNSQSHY